MSVRITYAPNQERDVVLGCGCLETWAFAIRILGTGQGKWWQGCPKGHVGPGKWGLQPIIREATINERIQFYERGIPATVRRARGTSKAVSKVPGKSKRKASTERSTGSHDANQTLF